MNLKCIYRHTRRSVYSTKINRISKNLWLGYIYWAFLGSEMNLYSQTIGWLSWNCLGKYAIWIYVGKYLNIAILFIISPRLMNFYRKFNPTLLHWSRVFFQSCQSVSHRTLQSFYEPSPGSGLVKMTWTLHCALDWKEREGPAVVLLRSDGGLRSRVWKVRIFI